MRLKRIDSITHNQRTITMDILNNLPNKEDLIKLIKEIQKQEFRKSMLDAVEFSFDDEVSMIDLTIATNGKDSEDWGFQTGDNSYSGACYSYHHWAVGYVDGQTNAEHLAIELLDQLEECLAYESLDC